MRYAHEQTTDSPPDEPCKRRGEYAVFTTCKCGPCLQGRRRIDKMRRAGRLPRTPAADAWAVLDALAAKGYGRKAIASAIPGVREETIADALDQFKATGHRQNFGRITAARIAAAGPDAQPRRGLVPAAGATRRLRALARLGHDLGSISAACGVDRNRLAYIRRGQPRTHVEVVAAVAEAYERLSMTIGGCGISRGLAEREGWLPPLAYDNIDDPQPCPGEPEDGGIDPVAVDRWLNGDDIDLTAEERAEVIRRAPDRGVPNGRLQARWRMSGHAFSRLRREALGQQNSPAAS